MSSIIRQKVGDKIYLYESTSYRNQQGQPRNRRVPIGKIDTATGNPIYKPEYLARMAAADKPIEIPTPNLEFSADDIRRSSKNGSTARIPFPFSACHHSGSVSY